MKTSTKVMIWAAVVASGVGIWQLVANYEPPPSGVREAVIVEVSGCRAIDLNLCKTVVDMDRIRLSRNGDYGDVGDTLLVTQRDQSRWSAPSAYQMEKYREEQSALSAREEG